MTAQINTLLVPMTRRDTNELFDLFSIMQQPGGTSRKRNFVISFDLGLSDEIQSEIREKFASSEMPNWFDLAFIDCNLNASESFYIRKFPEGFDKAAYPYGMKSGPNIQFFRSIRIAKERHANNDAVLIFETDITPLAPGWLAQIEAELPEPQKFLLAGPVYTGKSNLTDDIRHHINGASVYNWSHASFDRYMELWDLIVRLGCQHAPWQAYDTMPEWVKYYKRKFLADPEGAEVAEFLAFNQDYTKVISSIANLSGPAEREFPENLPGNLFFEKASVHLRAPIKVRKYWQDMVKFKVSTLKVEDLAVDREWQYPAITEQHAFKRLSKIRSDGSVLYFAFPWATLFDRYLHKPEGIEELLVELRRRRPMLQKHSTVVTVCQHVHMREFLDLMISMGITDVFWSHATKKDILHRGDYQIKLHPFPLYPVQFSERFAGNDSDVNGQRKFLFSFIGSNSPRTYLSESRNRIIEFLRDDPRGNIVERHEWHYNKVVYTHQILGDADKGNRLVDDKKSEEFRDSLINSTFSLCPSGSGPNSIRLWESLGAGSIPVILADTWAPPGDRRLWDMGAVFCPETRDAIKALPDRLAAIAADPARLAQMRHAMRQLWLLYGPQGFVTDVQEFLLSNAAAPATAPRGDDPLSAALAQGEGSALLQACASALLLEPAVTQGRIAADRGLSEALRKARAALPADAALARHYDAVSAHAARTAAATPAAALPAAPAVQRKVAPKIAFFGRHAKRTPLSYAPIRRLVGEALQIVDEPARADVLLTGFNIDLRENIELLQPLLKARKKPKILVLSEEPLWDITWSGPFTGREGKLSVNTTDIAYTFLGHETSDIYEFDRIPYFVLTSEVYAVRYANMMARFAGVTPEALLARWAQAPVAAAFFAESRKGEPYAKAFPERDVAALSAYRTELAERVAGDGVLRVGKGWGSDKPRQDLPDWHLDKLAQLDGRTRILSAIENVHQRLYISEKIFDAFAVGAIPVYWAGPKHRIADLVPAESMLNCQGLDPQAAAARIAGFAPDADFAATWLKTCARLADLFGNGHAIQAERRRVADATLKAILSLL